MLVAAAIVVRAVAIALLIRIAWRDFERQKIGNRDVLLLSVVGVIGLAVTAAENSSWTSLTIGLAAAAALFLLLFPFWMLKKVGAGDVKLLAVAPLVAGGDYLMSFAILLLVFAALTAFVVRNPLLLPASAFRRYVEFFDRKGVVPFGVPIAASLVGVLVMQAAVFSGGG